jgi:threonine dehydrogenase-like Zn-dependent dehydrogenase
VTTIAFDAFDYQADQTFASARYELQGSTAAGWSISRDGKLVLELGPGYRALRVRQCGVCSTDLARHFLPFPLPQVIGHEVVAVDPEGQRFVVEINASHTARGVAHRCAFCAAGLPTHCPDRVTLGIDALPGGFGQWILAPVNACLAVPEQVTDEDAVLVEPLAAALHAVTMVAPKAGERIAVLGPRRLGMLVVAGLAAVRSDYVVAAVVRDPKLGELAREFGADEVHVLSDDDHSLREAFDVVIDTTGSPAGLERAVRMARREVHLKSTHGQIASGVRHLTELVVDELGITRWTGERVGEKLAWLAASPPSAVLMAANEVRCGFGAELVTAYQQSSSGLPRADAAVVDSIATVEAAIRPIAGSEQPLIRPRGDVLLHPSGDYAASPLLHAIATRCLRLSSSRCGDFAYALHLLANSSLRGVGERLVTHRFAASQLPDAFRAAQSRDCIKAVIQHQGLGSSV